jgi:hypothetical protein
MQVPAGGVQHQPRERQNEEQRQQNDVRNVSVNSQPLRAWQIPPPGQRSTALADGYSRDSFLWFGFHCL